MDIKDLQEKHKPTAVRAAQLAQDRCEQDGLPLTKRQKNIVQGAILNVLVEIGMQRMASFVEAVKAEAERLEEIQVMDTDELADLLIDRVWSMLEIGTEESAVVEAAVERLRLLDA